MHVKTTRLRPKRKEKHKRETIARLSENLQKVI